MREPRPTTARDTRITLGAWTLALLLGAIGSVLLGDGPDPTTRLIALLDILLRSAWIPMLYLGASIGLGRIATCRAPDLPLHVRWTIETGAGLTIMLSLTHGLGVLGLLNPMSAWILVGAGLALLARTIHDRRDEIRAWSRTLTLDPIDGLALLGAGAILALACNPPGSLWDSEFGNYDSLSYHLELPRQWLELGRIAPLDSNVYSYLPGYMESTTLHLAHLALAPPADPNGLSGIVTDHGRLAISAQLLSALVTIGAAFVCGTLARSVLARIGTTDPTSERAARLVRALVLWTPWMIVVGTLTYNESAVVLLIASATIVALTTDLSITRRTILCALISAGACSCKPTALVLGIPIVGIALLAATPPRSWIRVAILGSLVGALALAPWLVRNAIASGNPVFPMASSLFGDGPWTPDQHTRYANAHTFDGSFLDRLTTLVLPREGRFHIERFRGYTNVQWGVFAGVGIVGAILALIPARTRRAALLTLVALGVTIGAWMALTHLQSRFLIPTIPALGVGSALALAAMSAHAPIRAVRAMALLVVLAGAAMSVRIISVQRGGTPNALLPLGVGAFTGEITSPELEDAFWWSGVNAAATDDTAVLLLGDATPLYVRSPVISTTVYDTSPIASIIEESPDDPSAWIDELRDQNIGWVVLNTSELARFRDSGWIDPMITQDHIERLIESLAPPVRVWPNAGRALFRIEPTP
jgi:hypothetical protein